LATEACATMTLRAVWKGTGSSFVSEIVTWHGRKPLGMQPVSRERSWCVAFLYVVFTWAARSTQPVSPLHSRHI